MSPASSAPSALRIRLSFYAVAALFAVPYGALNALNQNTQAVFGGAPGASDAAVARSDDVARLANVAISASWLISLFFVPAAIAGLRGARNAFAVMMFAWSGGAAALVGAYIQGDAGAGGGATVASGLYACGILFGLLVGLFGGLGYTATEVYLDICAEWMPLALEAAAAGASSLEAADTASKGSTSGGGAAAAKGIHADQKSGAGGAAAESRAEASLRHKFIASKYKNMFASQMYAFAEVGTVAFALPGAIGVTSGRSMLYFLVSITACLIAGALASLLVPNLHEPSPESPALAPDAKDAGGAEAAPPPRQPPCAKLVSVIRAAAQSAVRSVTCLSAYNWLAALAIVPYFLSAAWADNYFQFVIAGTQCGLRDAPDGIGLSGVNIAALFGSAVQALSAFAGPAMVGPRRGQFKEHIFPLALGNAAGAGAALAVVGLGGLSRRLCGSLGAMLATKAMSSIAYGINNSVGVAAVLCWYDGPYQVLVVSALASRSVWYQLGGVIGPYTFNDAFAAQGGGRSAAWLAAAIYLTGSVCVIAAYYINMVLEGRRSAGAAAAAAAAGDAEAGGGKPSAAELRLARTRSRMTAGFAKMD